MWHDFFPRMRFDSQSQATIDLNNLRIRCRVDAEHLCDVVVLHRRQVAPDNSAGVWPGSTLESSAHSIRTWDTMFVLF